LQAITYSATRRRLGNVVAMEKGSQGVHSTINSKELNMTALQGWIVIGLLVLIMLGIVGLGAEIKYLPYVWRTDTPSADSAR
jgi:hypothetical protein